MTHQTETSPATIVTQADRDLREALIGHWEDLPKAGIDKLLAEHRIASTTEAAALMDEMADALRKIAELDSDGLPTYTPQAMVHIATAVLAKLGGQHD